MDQHCKYGNRKSKKTWCSHPEVRGTLKSKPVRNEVCESCPLFEAGERRQVRTQEKGQQQCVHLLPIIEHVDCKDCGGNQKKFPVHGCVIHGECASTPRTFEKLRENGRRVKNCDSCKDRTSESKDMSSLPTVAVVIPCHNYGAFLGEAIESCKRQTLRPVEIVVVDDCSTDNTREVAEQHGVKYIRTEHANVFEARKTGYEATQSDLICFLDADDHLAPDYFEQAARLMQSNWKLGIVYSDMIRFGAENGRTNFPVQFDPVKFQRDNYLHAGSVVRRSALRISDAFTEERPSHLTHEDYLLWGRVLKFGWHARKSDAIYYYRRHEGGSMITGRRNQPWFYRMGHNRTSVSILIPLAGRSHYWPELRRWMGDQTWPREQTQLVLLDTSQDSQYSQTVRDWISSCDYPDVRHIQVSVGKPGLADEDRKKVFLDVQDAVLRSWQRLSKAIDHQWSFCLEDDVIPPPNVIESLFRDLQGGVDAVVAPYLGRYRTHWTVYRGDTPVLPGEEGVGVEKVDGAGFGCMLTKSHLLKDHVWTHGPRQGDWYDPWWAKLNKVQMICDWRIPVRHLPAEIQQQQTFVEHSA